MPPSLRRCHHIVTSKQPTGLADAVLSLQVAGTDRRDPVHDIMGLCIECAAVMIATLARLEKPPIDNDEEFTKLGREIGQRLRKQPWFFASVPPEGSIRSLSNLSTNEAQLRLLEHLAWSFREGAPSKNIEEVTAKMPEEKA